MLLRVYAIIFGVVGADMSPKSEGYRLTTATIRAYSLGQYFKKLLCSFIAVSNSPQNISLVIKGRHVTGKRQRASLALFFLSRRRVLAEAVES